MPWTWALIMSDNYHYGGVTLSHLFSLTPTVKIERSGFNRSNTYKTTFNAGKLIPFYCDEVLPGDTVNLKANLFCRMSTPIVPIMDNLYLETFFFFVPNRLVWSNFQKFMGEQINPGDSIDYVVPYYSTPYQVAPTSVLDYFGIPTGVNLRYNSEGFTDGLMVNVLPFRAYVKIWNDFFRDENLQNSLPVDMTDTNRVSTANQAAFPNGVFHVAGSCLPRGKRHDYFTSCLPTPQKFEALRIPLTGNAPVFGTGKALALSDGTNNAGLYRNSSGTLKDETAIYGTDMGSTVTPDTPALSSNKALGVPEKGESVESGLYADLSEVTAATINDLRTAFQIQRLLEAQNRSGTRYIEILAGQFHVQSPDARLQRPEYLGGSSARININPVMQTSATTSSDYTPQGNLAAYGVCADRINGFVKSFVEHGYIIGLVNVRADLTYQQGLNRLWSRRTRYDFYWPTLAHLGEQAVLNKEIYAQGTSDDEGVFGYNERWAEYRYKPNMITGKFRSTDSQPLDIWHLGQKFDSLPTLSDQFIRDNPPISRVVAVPDEPEFLLDVYFKEKWVRPMPVYSIPGLIDHF